MSVIFSPGEFERDTQDAYRVEKGFGFDREEEEGEVKSAVRADFGGWPVGESRGDGGPTRI